MYGFLWRIGRLDLFLMAAGFFLTLSAGFAFSIFPDAVQRWQLGLREYPGAAGRWFSGINPLHDTELRILRSQRYTSFVRAVGYVFLFVSGVLFWFLASYVMLAWPVP